MKKIIKILLPITTVVSILPTTFLSSCNKAHSRLTRTDWEDQTKTALNQCISTYGIDGNQYSKNHYAVFDFDNTSCIFDIAERTNLYQIENMCFDFKNISLYDALITGISDKLDVVLPNYGFSYSQIINEIVGAYDNLVGVYGPFSYKGVEQSKLEIMHNDNYWKDFSAKLRYLYDVICDLEGGEIAYTWVINLFSGLDRYQVYDISKRALSLCKDEDSKKTNLKAVSKIGYTEIIPDLTLINSVSVTENIKELYRVLSENKIDVWVCSASCIDSVAAALDVYGLQPYVTGLIGMTNKLDADNKYIPGYDHENGYDYIKKDGQWVKIDKPNKNIPFAEGKSKSIMDIIYPLYENHGPLMAFGDSTGDFNFATEFKDTKLSVFFNRANRSVKEGGGLLAAVAMYQKSKGTTLESANNQGDTLYCLQGRDENSKRTFRNSNKTIILDTTEEKLFKEEANYTMLAYMQTHSLTIKQAIDTLCIKDTVIEGITVGFLDTYIGYHER